MGVERMMQVLCRRRKNNPLLVGEPGVGKSRLVWDLIGQAQERLGLLRRPFKGGHASSPPASSPDRVITCRRLLAASTTYRVRPSGDTSRSTTSSPANPASLLNVRKTARLSYFVTQLMREELTAKDAEGAKFLNA